MPISQDRLIALIEIVDEALEARKIIIRLTSAELVEATDEFYANNGNDNNLASTMLAHLQALAAAIIDSKGLSPGAIETLAREREHFRLRRKPNIRSAAAMARRRNRQQQKSEGSNVSNTNNLHDVPL